MNPETEALLLKYTKRNANMPVEDQTQFWRYLGDWLCSTHGSVRNVGSYHGGGSPLMEQLTITSQYDIESRKKLVRYIAVMSDGNREALSTQ